MVEIACSLSQSLGLVAPYYNLALVAALIVLFLVLFGVKSKKVFFKPWKFLFFSILVYVAEEILTVMGNMWLITVPKILFPLLEMVIITSFTYMLLLQKEYIKARK